VIYSTLSMNYIQLDWLNFIFPLRNLACYSYIQKFRIKSLLERQTKKAAEELNKARMQQLNARVKEGEISLHYFFHSSPLISFNFALSSAKQAMPPPLKRWVHLILSRFVKLPIRDVLVSYVFIDLLKLDLLKLNYLSCRLMSLCHK